MHVIHRKGWDIPERETTPEHLFLNRRALLKAGAALGAGTIAPSDPPLPAPPADSVRAPALLPTSALA